LPRARPSRQDAYTPVTPPVRELTAFVTLYPFRGTIKQGLSRLPDIHRLALKRDKVLIGWIALLVWGATAMCVGLILAGYRLGHPMATCVLAVLAVAAEREGIRLTPTVEVSVASFLCVFAAVIFGPVSAVVVGGSGLLADLPRRDCAQPILRWMTWTAIRVIVAGATGLAAVAVTRATSPGFLAIFGAVGAAFLVETTSDVGLTAIAPAIRATASWRDTVRTVGQVHIASVPLQAPMVAILAYTYITISPWSVALFAIPAVAAQRLLLLYRRQRETLDALGAANARL